MIFKPNVACTFHPVPDVGRKLNRTSDVLMDSGWAAIDFQGKLLAYRKEHKPNGDPNWDWVRSDCRGKN